ncbi:MAG: ORF6N domain-containing protein [Campylobacterota bacterium]|nr:ORF6N domain-containing protein [Campylobacterota bacterium]
MNQITTITKENIQDKIYTIRGLQVMLDEDLAELYQVETKVFNQAVKRNIERFPEHFRFQLTEDEYQNLRSQIVTLKLDSENNRGKHRKYLPYVFTEQGVAMLSAILKSKVAVQVSIQIIDTFVQMRKFISNNALIFERLDTLEQKQFKNDGKFNEIFDAIESKDIKPKQGIFYDGQVYDAYIFVSDLIKKASKSIILIDNYIDESILTLLSKRDENISVTIYTKNITKQIQLDLKKYNEQYPKIEIQKFTTSHDRFLIIDEKDVYHIGASLKDLGKKWFAFSKLEIDAFDILSKLEAK